MFCSRRLAAACETITAAFKLIASNGRNLIVTIILAGECGLSLVYSERWSAIPFTSANDPRPTITAYAMGWLALGPRHCCAAPRRGSAASDRAEHLPGGGDRWSRELPPWPPSRWSSPRSAPGSGMPRSRWRPPPHEGSPGIGNARPSPARLRSHNGSRHKRSGCVPIHQTQLMYRFSKVL